MCWKRRSPTREGMTLIEVVAALVLAATVLSTVLIAYSRSVRQERLARDRLQAVQIAEKLLAEWFSPDGTVPLPEDGDEETAEGPIVDPDGWWWRISPVPAAAADRSRNESPFVVTQYKLEILSEPEDGPGERSLLTVEFIGKIRPIRPHGMTGAVQ